MSMADALFDAVADVDNYLTEYGYGHYDDALQDRIVAVRNSMEELRCDLDSAEWSIIPGQVLDGRKSYRPDPYVAYIRSPAPVRDNGGAA